MRLKPLHMIKASSLQFCYNFHELLVANTQSEIQNNLWHTLLSSQLSYSPKGDNYCKRLKRDALRSKLSELLK
jgi:hypothetical protein